jgi:hypothetical protein
LRAATKPLTKKFHSREFPSIGSKRSNVDILVGEAIGTR